MKTKATTAEAKDAAKKLNEIMSAYEITEHLTFNQVSASIRRGHQSINYDQIIKVTHQGVTKKMKIEIKRDSIASQSYAKVSVWSTATESWNQVTSLAVMPGSLFEKINPYEQDPGLLTAERRMKIIAGNLINTAAEVVF